MRLYLIVLFVSLAFASTEISDPDYFTDGLWNPMAFTVLDGDREALVIDYATEGEIVYRLDLHAGAHHGRALAAGPGPGELNDGGDKIIGQFADGSFFLWDSGDRRASLFDADLTYIGPVRESERGRAATMALVNDSTVAVLRFSASDELFTIHRLTRAADHAVIAEEPLYVITTAAHEALQPMADNPLLRQGWFHRQEDTLCWGVRYSSLVVCFDEQQVHHVGLTAGDLQLPDYKNEPGVYEAPDAAKYPSGIVDISGDARHVYVLFSDRKVSRLRALRVAVTGGMSGLESLLDDVLHTDQLHVLDGETGALTQTITLPVRGKHIDVKDGYVYLLNTADAEPTIHRVERGAL